MNSEIKTGKRSKGIFITGTDTGVGKTFVACGIAAFLRSQGADVGVMKPAETGCRMRKGSLVPQDAIDLARAAETSDSLDLINPCRFREPLAPAVAARIEGRRVDRKRIDRAFRTLAAQHDLVIVEGAGGIMVPLTERTTFLDLAAKLGLPVLIVARPGLGTINHTLLTIQALRGRSVPIAGICMNDSKGGGQGIAERTSPGVIERMSSVPVLSCIGHGRGNTEVFREIVLKLGNSVFLA